MINIDIVAVGSEPVAHLTAIELTLSSAVILALERLRAFDELRHPRVLQ